MDLEASVPCTAELHEEIRQLRQKLTQLKRRELTQLKQQRQRSQPLSRAMLVGVAGLAVQQKFPDQVERLRELLRHLASRTAPLQRAAAAVCQQQRPKLGGLLNHARGHGMRLLHGGRHNVHKAAQAVATQCSKRVRALQEARKGDAPCPPQGRRPFPFDDDDELEEVYTLGGGDATFQSGVIQLLQRASNADASSEPPMESIPEAEEEELGEVEGELEEFEAAEAEVQAQVLVDDGETHEAESGAVHTADDTFVDGIFKLDVAALLTSLHDVKTMQRLQEVGAGAHGEEDVVDVETLKGRVEHLKERAEKVRSMMHSMRIEDASEALQAVEAAEAAAGRMTEEERALCDEARAQEMAEEAKVKLDSMLAAQRAAQNTRVASLSPMEALRSARVSPETLTPRAQGKLDSDSVARVSPNLTTTAAKPRGKPAWNSNAKVSPSDDEPITMNDVNAVMAEMAEQTAGDKADKALPESSYIAWLLPPWVL